MSRTAIVTGTNRGLGEEVALELAEKGFRVIGTARSGEHALNIANPTSVVIALADEFVSSVANGTHERKGWPSSAYSVSKALVNAYTRVLARDLEAKGVRVNAVCPGWVRTRMGGRSAPRSIEEGAAGIVWAAINANGATGGFFRDGHAVPW